MPTIQDRFRCRRGTAAALAAANEVPLDSEIVLESDTGLGKIGDGATHYNDLLYRIVGNVDITGLQDGYVLAWDATAKQWKAGQGGSGSVQAVMPGTNISVDSTNPAKPIVSSTLGIVNLKTRVPTYADLPNSGNTTGDAILVAGPPKQIYVWDGSSWPAEGEGFAGGGSMAVPDYADTVIADAPIAFWPLDEVSGAAAVDASGNSRNGAYLGGYDLGIAPTINLPGAVLLNGSNGYVSQDYASWMDLTDVSLECWLYLLASPSARMGFITRAYDTGDTPIPYELGVNMDTGSTPQIAQYNGSWQSVKSSIGLAVQRWYHLVGTRAADGTANIYLNGIKANQPASMGTIVSSSTFPLYLGRQHNSLINSVYMNGALSCCAIYDKVLTPAQVSKHYSVGSIPAWLALP